MQPGYETGPAVIGICYSDDLRSWDVCPPVLSPEGIIDSRYAHKPGMISRGKTLYHFYCAVAPAKDKRLGEIEHGERRGIAVATN